RLCWLAKKLECLVWRSADRIFSVTGVLGEIIAAAGVAHEQITVVPNGVNRNSFPAGSYRYSSNNTVVFIGFVGFVRDWHGLNAVIAGLASERAAPPIRLVIIGPTSPALEQQAHALGV